VIALKHNIRAVRNRLERFAQKVDKIPTEVITTRNWIDDAKREARQVLTALAKPEDQPLVQQFVETASVIVFGIGGGAGMIWSMDLPREIAVNLAELTIEQKEKLWENRRDFLDRAQIEEWVKNEKILDERDDDSVENAIRNVLAILFGPENDKRKEAGWSLMFGKTFSRPNHMLEEQIGFLWQFLKGDEIKAWMKAVRTVWREFILDEIPVMIRSQIREAWKESKV
jgi:hypothetical protein